MKYKVSNECIKKRGLVGLALFIASNGRNMIKKTIENNGTGYYVLSFKKVDELERKP